MARITVIFDDTCRICTGSVRFIRAFDWLGRFSYAGYWETAATDPELAAVSVDDGVRARFPDGSSTVGIDAVRSIAMRTVLGAPVAWLLYLPPVRWFGAKVYRFIADRRSASCRIDHGPNAPGQR